VGTGRELGALQDAGYEPTGLDASEAMLAICGRRARPVPLVHADFWVALPFPDGSFAACVALHGTLAHPASVGDYGRLGRELARVLAPGGVFVAEVPSPALFARTGEVASATGRLIRVDATRFRHEDEVLGAAVEGFMLADEDWKNAFSPELTVEVQEAGEAERLVVARRR
jgi:SAM-dependent methyltransferase